KEKYDLEAEILKVAHHGSDTSTSKDFLEQVNPHTAILSYGERNDFGHPVDRVMDNLYQADADIYSTAVYGNIIITTNGSNYLTIPEKNPLNQLIEKAG